MLLKKKTESRFPVSSDEFFPASKVISAMHENVQEGPSCVENMLYTMTNRARRKASDGEMKRVCSDLFLIRTSDFTDIKLSAFEALTAAGYKGIEIDQDMRAGGADKDDVCGIRIQFAW